MFQTKDINDGRGSLYVAVEDMWGYNRKGLKFVAKHEVLLE